VAIHKADIEIGGRTLTIETGKVAELSDGSAMLRYGDTVLLATAVSSADPREGIDFFPLTVEYEERMYAAGKIPGGFIKLVAPAAGHPFRALDRSTDPPLFPKYYRNDVRVVNLVSRPIRRTIRRS
jgi:polyribonucleotide nucleotidyltransferase